MTTSDISIRADKQITIRPDAYEPELDEDGALIDAPAPPEEGTRDWAKFDAERGGSDAGGEHHGETKKSNLGHVKVGDKIMATDSKTGERKAHTITKVAGSGSQRTVVLKAEGTGNQRQLSAGVETPVDQVRDEDTLEERAWKEWRAKHPYMPKPRGRGESAKAYDARIRRLMNKAVAPFQSQQPEPEVEDETTAPEDTEITSDEPPQEIAAEVEQAEVTTTAETEAAEQELATVSDDDPLDTRDWAKVCKECDSVNAVDAKFCDQCGSELKSDSGKRGDMPEAFKGHQFKKKGEDDAACATCGKDKDDDVHAEGNRADDAEEEKKPTSDEHKFKGGDLKNCKDCGKGINALVHKPSWPPSHRNHELAELRELAEAEESALRADADPAKNRKPGPADAPAGTPMPHRFHGGDISHCAECGKPVTDGLHRPL